MPRLEVELTSARRDGTWTWRKAGARQPKGEVEATLLPEGAKVGDVLRVEADVLVDGIDITSVLPPKGERKDRFERIEIKGRPAPENLVSTTLAPRRERSGRGEGRGGGRDREGRGGREGRGDGRGRGDSRGPGQGAGAEGGARRPSRPARPRPPELELPDRPKPKRLRPGRTHRNAVLEALPPEQRPIAEQVLQGGVPAVRQAIEKQNEQNKASELPEIKGDELVHLAEQLLPQLRAAEWHDRADAALAIVDEIDLRDLRTVVVAADSGRDDESKALAQQLRDALTRRVDEEHQQWLEELRLTLKAERVVRALRLRSRPPKAGAPLPPDLSAQLTAAASASLTAEISPERWATVLDALAFSPVRTAVEPASIPDPVPDAVRDAVLAAASRLPHIAEKFGIDPASAPKPSRRRPAARKAKAGAAKGPDPSKGPKPEKKAAAKPGDADAEATPAEAEPTPIDAEAVPAEAPTPAPEAVTDPETESAIAPVTDPETESAIAAVADTVEEIREPEAVVEAKAETTEAIQESEAVIEAEGGQTADVEVPDAQPEPEADTSGEA